MQQKTHKNCKVCGTEFKLYRTTQKYCSGRCEAKDKKPNLKWKPLYIMPKQKKPINKVSKKQAVINAKYSVQRIQFLAKPENKFCIVEGCGKLANTVDHQKGRKGFADEFARENNIPLTLDERFWIPCCLEHNLEFENNPELSKKYQLSKLHNGKKN